MQTTLAKPKKNLGGRPKVPQPRVPITSFRGSPEFAAWFEGLCEFARLSSTSTIEHSLILYAREKGYTRPAPKR